METPILKTKINIPPARENVLQRHAIYNRMDANANKNLILVSAPAGYGKTTLLSEWARRKKRRLAWVSLDGYDNDLGRFLSHMVAALQTILPEVGKLTLATLQSATQASPVSALTVLINEIENVRGERAERLVLVLDDYHVIETQEIHTAMDYLLDNLPAQMQVVISSRAEPPLAVSRFRARHQLAEFHANDLRFTSDDTGKFLTQSMGLALPPETIAALEARMEGWVAGLQLAALSIQERGGSHPGFFDALSGSHRRILDYLMGEILARQPEATRAFLFQTSILDYLTGELCDAVCDLSPQGSGQEILETLDRMNLFVVRMDDEGRWYRYHRIFADVLSARLKLATPAQLPRLHQRASEWYEKNGRVHEAVKHALAADDFNRVAFLVEQTDPANMILRGEVTTILGWLDALPNELIRSRPRLSLSYAWALFIQGKMDAIEAHLQDTLAALGVADSGERDVPIYSAGQTSAQELNENPGMQGYLGEIAAIRAWVALEHRNEPLRAIGLAQEALAHLPPNNTLMNSALYSIIGDANYKIDQMETAEHAYRKAIAVSQLGRHEITTLVYLADLARLQIARGMLREAVENYRLVIEQAGSSRANFLFPVARALIGLGVVACQRNELDDAYYYLQRGIAQCEQAGYTQPLLIGLLTLARVKHLLSQASEAHQLLQRAEQLAVKRGRREMLAQVEATRFRVGMPCSVQRLAQVVGIDPEQEPDPLLESGYLTLCEMLISAGREKGDKASTKMAARVQGQERYYTLLLSGRETVRLVRRLDGETILAEKPLSWHFGQPYNLRLEVHGSKILAWVNGELLFAVEDENSPLTGGGIALVSQAGRMGTEWVQVRPCQ